MCRFYCRCITRDSNFYMSEYIKNPTQEERIIDLLRKRGKQGAYVYEFMTPRNIGGLGISQYNARILGLRAKGYIIENVVPGHFVLKYDIENPHTEPKQMNLL